MEALVTQMVSYIFIAILLATGARYSYIAYLKYEVYSILSSDLVVGELFFNVISNIFLARYGYVFDGVDGSL